MNQLKLPNIISPAYLIMIMIMMFMTRITRLSLSKELRESLNQLKLPHIVSPAYLIMIMIMLFMIRNTKIIIINGFKRF